MKNKIKERMERILHGSILFTTLLTLAFPVQAWAKVGGNETEYTYTVTLCAGNQGYFSDTNGITVDNHITGSSYQIEKESQGEKIKISGLKYGDRVMVRAQSCIQLKEDGKYYIGGIRESGRDNNTVGKSAFVVESDQEYVAAYAIAGNMVAYTVNYQDANGNALSDSETFYGAVGDQPVVAFKYFENYRPQAYNLTKTLNSNEAENILRLYTRRIHRVRQTVQMPEVMQMRQTMQMQQTMRMQQTMQMQQTMRMQQMMPMQIIIKGQMEMQIFRMKRLRRNW